MTYKPATRRIVTRPTVVDMAGQSTFDISPPQRFPDIEGFRIQFWDVNQVSSSQGFGMRFRNPSLISTGYDSVAVERLTGGGISTPAATTIAFNTGNLISGLGLSRGWWEVYLGDRGSTYDYFVNGQFYDDNDDSVIDHWGHITLGGSGITGMRIQSINVTNYTAGSFAYQWWGSNPR